MAVGIFRLGTLGSRLTYYELNLNGRNMRLGRFEILETWHGTWNHDMAWQGATLHTTAGSWFHVPCHFFGVMGLFFGPLGNSLLESWASFLDP